jgi:hypothetical protein
MVALRIAGLILITLEGPGACLSMKGMLMRIGLCGLSLALATAAASVAGAATFYVSPAGLDANPGTQDKPLRTIQKGVDLARAGDTVLVRGGVYKEHVVLRRSGEPERPIVLRGFAGERPVVDTDGQGRIELKSESGWQQPIGWISVEGFDVRNGWDGIKFYNAHHIALRGNHIHDNSNQGILGNGHHVRIEGNVIARNGFKPDNERSNLEHGIYGTGTHFTIVNNVIHSCSHLSGSRSPNPATNTRPRRTSTRTRSSWTPRCSISGSAATHRRSMPARATSLFRRTSTACRAPREPATTSAPLR